MLKTLSVGNEKLVSKKEILWIHFCRILGSLAVIALHVSAYTTEAWAKWGLISVSIWAVPVFTMVSGALLPKKFIHRLKRLATPMLIWLPIFYIYFHQDKNIFSWNTLTNILVWGDVGHLYYFFILFGLAAVTSLLRNLIKKLTKVDLIKLIGLFVLIGFFWKNSRLTPSYFIPYLGYYLLGYYLAKINITGKFLTLAWVIFSMAAAMLFLSIQIFNANSYLFQHGNPLIFCLSVSAFVIIKNSHLVARFFSLVPISLTRNLATLTLGVYILHPLILGLTLTKFPHIPWYLILPAITFTFVVSVIITYLLKRLKPIEKLGIL